MDVAVDWYLVVPLLFTVLAIVLASVFVRLRRGEGERPVERPREPAAAEPAREGGPGSGGEAAPEGAGPAEGSEDERGRLPVEEVGAGEEEEKKKEAAVEQREEAAEPGPAAEPSPAAAESIIPRQPPAEPREPVHREDAESKIPTVGASSGSSPGHTGPAEDGVGQAELPSKAEEEDPDSENEKLMVREPEDEDEDAADETFSFKYSPGKLRGNQYKSMMTKEELEEEQRTEDYMKLSLASS
ncbi:matrix-remodeling-associated protein 7 [Patagioenas fasciata monilis]|uniref:Matrix-remodeling-associated protein 7 n=1 Tax=Patagioenas fasciata monilis TaxID=372326 RepID=A0A1V4KWQ4_PATFA|nr:matrix-remodeling-associated protein 7 [Patagioenas fasciata monilis]